jgi:hypothetical protein
LTQEWRKKATAKKSAAKKTAAKQVAEPKDEAQAETPKKKCVRKKK